MKNLTAALLALLAWTGSSAAQEVRHTLWIDPRRLDLNDARVRTALLKHPMQRLIVSVFEEGETLFAHRGEVFPQMANYRGKADPLPALLKEAQGKGIKVYAYAECLRWTGAKRPAQDDLLEKHLKWAERNFQLQFGTPPADKFASPFNAEVVRVLRGLVEEIAARYPTLDGLALKCELSAEEMLGFSYPARMNYLRERGVDLWAVEWTQLFGEGQKSETARAWQQWRAQKMAGLVQELQQVYHKKSQGKLALVGRVESSQMPVAVRAQRLNDYARWAQDLKIGELILEWQLGVGEANYAGYKGLRELARTSSLELTVAPSLWSEQAAYGPQRLRDETRDQEIHAVAVRVRTPKDIDWLESYRHDMSNVEALLPRGDLLRLKYDAKLEVRLGFQFNPAMLEDLLQVLRKATKLDFAPSRPWSKAIYSSYGVEGVTAWYVMEEIGTRTGGRWEKTKTGYRLVLP